jgi:hypothetical protein
MSITRTKSPDKVPDHLARLQRVAAERFRALKEAYDILVDPVRRAAYDLQLFRARQRTPRATSPPTTPPQPPPHSSASAPAPPSDARPVQPAATQQAAAGATPTQSTRCCLANRGCRGWTDCCGGQTHKHCANQIASVNDCRGNPCAVHGGLLFLL